MLVPRRAQPWLYRAALERGYLDAILIDGVLGTLSRLLLRLDALDGAFTAWLAGERSAGSAASRSDAVGDPGEELV